MKLTGKPYSARDAYKALDRVQDIPDPHGRRIWGTRVPNKVKVFAWLFFKDRLSTRANLHVKHVLEDGDCQRCVSAVEDRHHTFFCCPVSSEVWRRLGLSNVSSLSDEDAWTSIPSGLSPKLWPFVLLTILWRLWDARNGEIFRSEAAHSRVIISRVCDDFVTWRKRLKSDHDVNSLNDWRAYLLACNSVTSSSLLEG